MDEDKVGLLEMLEGDWCRRIGSSGYSNNAMGSRGGVQSTTAIARMRPRGKTIDNMIAPRQLLWKSESETDEDETLLEKLQREVEDETTEEEEVVEIGSLDSYSEESVHDEDDDERHNNAKYYSDDSEEEGGMKRARRAQSEPPKRSQSRLHHRAPADDNEYRSKSMKKGTRSSMRKQVVKSSLAQMDDVQNVHVHRHFSKEKKQQSSSSVVSARRYLHSAKDESRTSRERKRSRHQASTTQRHIEQHSSGVSSSRRPLHYSSEDESRTMSRERKRSRQASTHHHHSPGRSIKKNKPMNEIIIAESPRTRSALLRFLSWAL